VPVFICRSGNPLAICIGLKKANFNLSCGFCDDRQKISEVELTFGIFRLQFQDIAAPACRDRSC
jgi:hypothetical protein